MSGFWIEELVLETLLNTRSPKHSLNSVQKYVGLYLDSLDEEDYTIRCTLLDTSYNQDITVLRFFPNSDLLRGLSSRATRVSITFDKKDPSKIQVYKNGDVTSFTKISSSLEHGTFQIPLELAKLFNYHTIVGEYYKKDTANIAFFRDGHIEGWSRYSNFIYPSIPIKKLPSQDLLFFYNQDLEESSYFIYTQTPDSLLLREIVLKESESLWQGFHYQFTLTNQKFTFYKNNPQINQDSLFSIDNVH
ncbi:hypothetical protein [Sediminitomix flava]|uniref:Uncharacterized protein n=1 Tax=Sediminitomix flava TaxID=379075 RepID=A0A315ZFY9_SEDFL|nr:hypothetical protein [Sediminitomix flava]PWJ44050.1 hypothetical protein BC781_101400 [Sediminitomix flava]